MLKQIYLYQHKIGDSYYPESFKSHALVGNYYFSLDGLKGIADNLMAAVHVSLGNSFAGEIKIKTYAPVGLEGFCSSNVLPLTLDQRKEFQHYLPKNWQIKWVSKRSKKK